MKDIEEKLKREIEKAREILRSASQKIDEIRANTDLTNRIIWLINDLSEKGDERIRGIGDAYSSILRTEKDISRVPWRVLEYLEANHLDLYRIVQTSKLQT